MNNLPKRKLAVALAGSVLMLTAACGGGGGGRPSVSDLEKALSDQSNGVFGSEVSSLSDKARDCIAKALHDSKVSDAALQAIVDGDKDYKASSADKSAASDLESDIAKCATDAAK